jgi:hypothetical protein
MIGKHGKQIDWANPWKIFPGFIGQLRDNIS